MKIDAPIVTFDRYPPRRVTKAPIRQFDALFESEPLEVEEDEPSFLDPEDSVDAGDDESLEPESDFDPAPESDPDPPSLPLPAFARRLLL